MQYRILATDLDNTLIPFGEPDPRPEMLAAIQKMRAAGVPLVVATGRTFSSMAGKLPEALDIARKTHRIVMENIVFALGVKFLFLLLGALGIAGMWMAVIGDVGVMVAAVLNAMRMMRH